MARGQQPSQYQPSKPQAQHRPSENSGNGNASDDDLITFENKSNSKTKVQEFNEFCEIVHKAILAENKATKAYNDELGKNSTITLATRSSEATKMLDAIKKIKSSIEPQKLLPNLEHLTPEEKETCNDLLQVMNTRYEKLIKFHNILALERELTIEEQETAWTLFDEIKTLKENTNEILKRMTKMFK